MLHPMVRMGLDAGGDSSSPPQPAAPSRLSRAAFLVVLLVIALSPWILDSGIPAESLQVIITALASACAFTLLWLSSLRATGR